MSDRVKKYRRHGSRYRARRRAVDVLFEAEARDVDPVAIVEDRVELAREKGSEVAPVAAYTREIVAGVAERLDYLDTQIEGALLENWELHRLPAVDRAILRFSTWELIFNPEVPKRTAVVEGVELASEYSGDEASSYINGVLDQLAGRAERAAEKPADPETETGDEKPAPAEEKPAPGTGD